MKKSLKLIIISTFFILTLSTIALAFCTTDYQCVQDCMNEGYLYNLCQKMCTYCY